MDDDAAGTGTFTESVAGLNPNTSYSFVAFATNDIGAAYTAPVSTFGTPPANVFGWAYNNYGDLGNSNTTAQSTPVAMPISGATGVASSEYNTLVVNANGTVSVTGDNTYGQLGNGTTGGSAQTVPVVVPNLSGVVAVAVGNSDCFALESNGTVWAWGLNAFKELGNGTTTSSSVPVQVSGLTGVTAIAAGFEHALALESNGNGVGLGA